MTRPRLWLLLVLLFALSVRLVGLDWDQGHHYHPDERAIVDAVGRISLDPSNPQLNPKFFAYGSLPFYVMRAATDAVTVVWPAARSYDNLLLVGRGVSAVIGTLTVALTIALGLRLYSFPVALLAGFLLAASPLHIQNSHFATTDIFLTLMVLLALYCLVGLVQRGRARDYVYSGFAIGLALATKFSAAPLLAPLGVALLIRLYRDRRLVPVIGGALLAAIGIFVAFFIGQPYAVLDFNEFYKDVFEQSLMVRTAGLFPYTHQYIGAPKYSYEIAHIVLFGMAPALGLVAVWATARKIIGFFRDSGEDLVLLAWVVPFFLVTGWFDVKFVRYLLPIYPVMCLWAAGWLRAGHPSRLRQILTWVVIGGSVLASLAFLSIYTRPHTVVTASEWVYRHVPPDSTILTQHWDEGFPFSLPGFRSTRYTVTELPYYEHDKASKMREISRALANADFIAFQTKRLYGSLTRAPEKYPLTNKYFYMLFAGDLGYTLIYDHASRPSLFGIEFPDELIDESISVYDHPKVLIFQNTGKLSEDEIFDRIMNGYPSKQLTRNDLLLARAGEDGMAGGGSETTLIRSSWLALLGFVVVVELLGLSAYAILFLFLPVSGSYALAKILGILVFAYAPWLLTGLGQVEFNRTTLVVTMTVMLVVGVVARRRWPTKPTRGEWVPTEILFWGAFCFFLAVRAFNPEVFWGEKPMDFAFLNALTRSAQLPPPEPWFAGSALHYSYFGQYFIAALGKLCAIHPALTFNLGIGLTAGLTASGAFALGCALSDRWRVGILAAVFTTLLGNLAGLREVIERKTMNFDYFWATSRVIKDTINEYPFWTFLFADLHAHMLVMPFSLAFVTLSIWWVRRDELRLHMRRPAILLLLGLTLGAIIVTNTWSAFTYIPFFPFLLGVVFIAHTRGVLRFLVGIVTQIIAPSVTVGLLAITLYLPYWRTWSAPERNWGWEHDAFANLYDFVNIFGLFLFILVPYLFLSWRRQLLPPHTDRLGWARALPIWIVAIGVIVSLFFSVRTGLVMLAVLALHLALDRSTTPRHRLVFILTAFAFAVTAGCDFIHVWDRMNTIFKFYLEAWFLFAAASAAAAYELWRGALRTPSVRYAWRGGLAVLLALAAFTAVSATYGVIGTNRVRTPRPTLDGIAYLPLRDAHEAAAFEWLNQTIDGIPVITEAYGPSYQEYGRVSMNTGLPTVLGWDYHVFQRAHTWADINRRKSDLEKLYTTDNEDAAKAILQKYHVALVYVGPVERKRYSGGNVERFKEWTDILTPVYQNAGVTIFGVNGQFTTQQVLTIEAVPSEEGGEEEQQPVGAPGQLRQPRGVAVNSKGEVYVADFDNNRVQVFDPDLGIMKVLGEKGDLPGQFKQPCGVAIDATDTVFVADTWNQRVQVFNPEGAYQREFGGAFYGPRGIAVSKDGKVYLADTGNHRIRRFNAATGKEERTWGGLGSEPGQFKEPIGVATDESGRVYVCDNGNARIQIFDAEGKLESTIPVEGWETKVFSEPYIAITPEGTIWVTIPLHKAIRAYDRSGKVLHEISGEQGEKTLFRMPIGIAYDRSANDLVVTDLENNVVRIPTP